MRYELVDIGANLAHDSFDEDRDNVLQRAFDAKVITLLVTGSSNGSNVAALELARQYPDRLFSTAGVHPHHASDFDAASDEIIRECLADDRCVAVGGLVFAGRREPFGTKCRQDISTNTYPRLLARRHARRRQPD